MTGNRSELDPYLCATWAGVILACALTWFAIIVAIRWALA